MSKKKNKFDLTSLVHKKELAPDQTLYFVSDPAKTCQIAKQPNGEYKVTAGEDTLTIHQFAEKCLGTEPPVHASKWLRTDDGRTLYDIWHAEDELDMAA